MAESPAVADVVGDAKHLGEHLFPVAPHKSALHAQGGVVADQVGGAGPQLGDVFDALAGEPMPLQVVDDEGVPGGADFTDEGDDVGIAEVVEEQGGMEERAGGFVAHGCSKIALHPADAGMGILLFAEGDAVGFQVPALGLYPYRQLLHEAMEGVAAPTADVDEGMKGEMGLYRLQGQFGDAVAAQESVHNRQLPQVLVQGRAGQVFRIEQLLLLGALGIMPASHGRALG